MVGRIRAAFPERIRRAALFVRREWRGSGGLYTHETEACSTKGLQRTEKPLMGGKIVLFGWTRTPEPLIGGEWVFSAAEPADNGSWVRKVGKIAGFCGIAERRSIREGTEKVLGYYPICSGTEEISPLGEDLENRGNRARVSGDWQRHKQRAS